jgi:hypothetical protein
MSAPAFLEGACAAGLAHIRREGVSHAYALRRYACSGWWAGVPHRKAAL